MKKKLIYIVGAALIVAAAYLVHYLYKTSIVDNGFLLSSAGQELHVPKKSLPIHYCIEKQEHKDVIVVGAQWWNDRLGYSIFRLTEVFDKNCQIIVRQDNELFEKENHKTALALAGNWSDEKTGIITRSVISYGEGALAKKERNQIAIFAHEFGHTLGLAHDGAYWSIMAEAIVADEDQELTKADKKRLLVKMGLCND